MPVWTGYISFHSQHFTPSKGGSPRHERSFAMLSVVRISQQSSHAHPQLPVPAIGKRIMLCCSIVICVPKSCWNRVDFPTVVRIPAADVSNGHQGPRSPCIVRGTSVQRPRVTKENVSDFKRDCSRRENPRRPSSRVRPTKTRALRDDTGVCPPRSRECIRAMTMSS